MEEWSTIGTEGKEWAAKGGRCSQTHLTQPRNFPTRLPKTDIPELSPQVYSYYSERI